MSKSDEDLKKPGTWENFFCEDFMNEFYVGFLHHQTLCQIDQRGIHVRMKEGEGCVLALFTPSDEANAVFQYLNNYKKWGEIAKHIDDLDHACHSKREGGTYTKTVGRKRFTSGFTDEGMEIYGKILKFVVALRAHDDYPKLEEACKKYFKEDAGGAALRRACSNSGPISSAVAPTNNTVQEKEAFVDEDLADSDSDDEDGDDGGEGASGDDDDEVYEGGLFQGSSDESSEVEESDGEQNEQDPMGLLGPLPDAEEEDEVEAEVDKITDV